MGGFDQGFAYGGQLAEQHTARKNQLADEERQMKAGPLIETSKALIAKLPNLTGADLDTAKKQLADTQAAFDELYHPIKAPGAIQRDAHFLLSKIKGIGAPKDKTPTSTTSQTPAMALNTPVAPITTPELPAYQQVTPALPSQGGAKTTEVPGVASQTLPAMAAPPKGATPTMAVAKPKGLLEAGNTPIWNRPSVLNDDGTHSSELSISIGDEKGNETLIPLIVDGKFLTPNGKMPAGDIPHNAQEWEKASPEWKALKMQAEKHYEQTGQHLGKFGGGTPEENQSNVEAYAQVLHNRGVGSSGAATIPAGPPVTVTKAPPVPWAQGQVQKLKDTAMVKAKQQADLLAAGTPLSPQQQGTSQANEQAAARWASLRADIANWDKDNPNASKEDRDAIYQQLYSKWVGTTGRGNWETVTGTVADPSDPSKRNPVSYSFDKASNRLTDFNGTPVNPEIASSFIPDPKATGAAAENLKEYAAIPDPKPPYAEWLAQRTTAGRAGGTLTFDKTTGQVSDKATGKRYTKGDPNNPPEVATMFRQADIMDAKNKAFQLQLAGIRGAAYNQSKPMTTLDSANGNAPTVVTFKQMQENPGRFVPATEADKAIAKENLMQDIAGTSKLTRNAITKLTPDEDFTFDMKAKIALAMKADDPHAALDQLIASGALGSLTSDQQDFLIATRQLAENAMAMRTILGAGQGSEDMRDAIRQTLPGLLSPDRSYALRQLNAFDATINRLHRGVPNVRLNNNAMAGSKGSKSLAAAMALPINKGKSADEVQQHMESLGYTVTKP